MTYHAMRIAWAARALAALLRRWGVYALVTALVAGAGVAGAPAIVAALAAAAVLPLFRAVADGAGAGAAAAAGYAAFGAALAWTLRPLLLPLHWLEAERALPVTGAERLRSDAVLTACALLPLFALYAAGSAAVLAGRPAWLRPHAAAALAALALAAAASVVAGALLLKARRRPGRGARGWRGWRRQWPATVARLTAASRRRRLSSPGPSPSAPSTPPSTPPSRWLPPWPSLSSTEPSSWPAPPPPSRWLSQTHAGAAAAGRGSAPAAVADWRIAAEPGAFWLLLALPLWRGPARRCGALLAGAALLAWLPLAGLRWWPAGGGWWLAALALAALALAARGAALVREELGPLVDAAAALPLSQRTLRRCAGLLPLLPLLPPLAALPAVLPPARTAVLAAFIAATAGAAALHGLQQPPTAETAAARWLLCLVVLLALASEVLA